MKRSDIKLIKLVAAVSACLVSVQAFAYDGPYVGVQLGINDARGQHYTLAGTHTLIAPVPPVPIDQTPIPNSGPVGDYRYKRSIMGQIVGGYEYDLGYIGLRPEFELSLRRETANKITLADGTDRDPKGTRLSTTTGFFNLWFDAFPSWFIHPYIGGGAGFARGILNHAQGDVYGTEPGAQKADDTKYAYQFGAGVTVDVYDGIAVGIDYRYVRTGTFQFFPFPDQVRTSIKSKYSAQSLLLGVRYYFDRPEPAEPVPAVAPVQAPKDSDGDGVVDGDDQCPGTPPGTQVDKVGCPLPPPPPPPPECKTPAPGEKISLAGCGTGDHIVLKGVNFDTNKATLTPNAKTLLNDVSGQLQKYPTLDVEIDGYTDSKGSAKYNQKLSERRAASVKKYLVESGGITADRMTSVGYGEANPVADNSTEDGRELNRRVELKITGGPAASSGSETAPAATETAPVAAPEAAAPAAAAPAAPASSAAPSEPANDEAPAAPASAAAAPATGTSSDTSSSSDSQSSNTPPAQPKAQKMPAPKAPSGSDSLSDILGPSS